MQSEWKGRCGATLAIVSGAYGSLLAMTIAIRLGELFGRRNGYGGEVGAPEWLTCSMGVVAWGLVVLGVARRSSPEKRWVVGLCSSVGSAVLIFVAFHVFMLLRLQTLNWDVRATIDQSGGVWGFAFYALALLLGIAVIGGGGVTWLSV